jgi:hypothetical protein
LKSFKVKITKFILVLSSGIFKKISRGFHGDFKGEIARFRRYMFIHIFEEHLSPTISKLY